MFERFDDFARMAMTDAFRVAIKQRADKLEAAHLCLGALLADADLAAHLGADSEALASVVDQEPAEGEIKYAPDLGGA